MTTDNESNETPAYAGATTVQPDLNRAPSTPGNGLGLAALIIGIVSLIAALIPFVNYVSGVFAVVGIVLGIITLVRKVGRRGFALWGLILSVIALLLSIILAVVYTVGFIAAVDDSLGDISTQPGKIEPGEDAGSAGDTDVGTRDNPAPLGTSIVLSQAGAPLYEVSLGASTLDATAQVAAANEFNEAPAEGLQYAMVPVTATYKGTDSGTPWVEIQIEFVSAAGTTHSPFDTSVVGPDPQFTAINELFPDATGTGNVVVAIPTADAAEGTWRVTTLFGGDEYFFAAQ
jgi:hypothetical protein